MSVRINPADRVVVTNFRYNPGSAISIFSLNNVNVQPSGISNGDVLIWDAASSNFVVSNTITTDFFGGTYANTGSVGGSTMQIRYSDTWRIPLGGSLEYGELAYSFLPDTFDSAANTWTGGSTLYIGDENGDPVAIGSNRIYEAFNHQNGVVVANGAVVTDSNGAIDKLTIGGMYFDGTTIDVQNAGSNLYLSPGGLANISATGHRIINVADPVNPQDALTLNYLQSQYSKNLTVGVNGVNDAVNLRSEALRFESTNTVLVSYDTLTNTLKFTANIEYEDTHVIISNTAPTDVRLGDLWYDSDDTGRTYVWDGTLWVDIAPQQIQEDLGLVHINSAPANPVTGEVWFDTANTVAYVWTGTSWQAMADPDDGTPHVIISTTQPTTVDVGDLWYDSNTTSNTYAITQVWDGATWLPVMPQAPVANTPLIIIANTAPANAQIGTAWYDSDDTGRTYVWDGTQWVDIAPSDTVATQTSNTVITISDTPPPTPWVGMPWFNTVDTTGYVWTGAEWLEFSDPDHGIPHSIIADEAPLLPDVGDIWIDSSRYNHPFVWNGTEWLDIIPPTLSSANALIIIANTAPANAQIGTAWYDQDNTGRTYVWDGIQWVDMNPMPLPPEDRAAITISDTQPLNPYVGQVWFDEDAEKGYAWNGGSWELFSDPNSGHPHVVASSVAPFTPLNGDIWHDLTSNTTSFWHEPGNAWIEISKPPVLDVTGLVLISNTAPSNVEIGAAWYDEDNTGRTYVWDGVQWVDMNPASNDSHDTHLNLVTADLTGANQFTLSVPSEAKTLVIQMEDFEGAIANTLSGGWYVDVTTDTGRVITKADSIIVATSDYPFSSSLTITNFTQGNLSTPSTFLYNKYKEKISSITIKPININDTFVTANVTIWAKV